MTTTMTPEIKRRRTHSRVQTWEALMALATTEGLDNVFPVSASNHEIAMEILDNGGPRLTLPGITARLQSLQEIGCIDVQYWLTPRGGTVRTIFLLEPPKAPA